MLDMRLTDQEAPYNSSRISPDCFNDLFRRFRLQFQRKNRIVEAKFFFQMNDYSPPETGSRDSISVLLLLLHHIGGVLISCTKRKGNVKLPLGILAKCFTQMQGVPFIGTHFYFSSATSIYNFRVETNIEHLN